MAEDASVWHNWRADLLKAAHLPETDANLRFLGEWHDNARTHCKLNPIDLHKRERGSKNCEHLPNARNDAQAYPSKNRTEAAFAAQLGDRKFHNIRFALLTGDPYGVAYYANVGIALGKWGSGSFGSVYIQEIDSGGVTGPGPGIPGDGDVLKAWGDFRRSVNVGLPRALHASQRSRVIALRELHRASRVKL